MAANFHPNMAFLFVPSCLAGTRWRRSNGCNVSLSRTNRSLAIIKRLITPTGRGEGTLPNSHRSPRCKSKRKSRGLLKARPCPQILMFVFTVLPGQTTVKSQKSKSAQMAEQHGAKQEIGRADV